MASSSSSSPDTGEALASRPDSRIVATPASNPEMAYTANTVRRTGTPAMRAASRLPPTDTTWRPNAVRLRTSQPTIANSDEDHDRDRLADDLAGAEPPEPVVVEQADRRLVAHLQRQAAGDRQHRQRGDERHDLAVGDGGGVDAAEQQTEPEGDEDERRRRRRCRPSSRPATPAAATIEPTERSMPAVAITNVMPIASTPTTLDWVRIARKLSIVGNVSGLRIAPTTISATITPSKRVLLQRRAARQREALGSRSPARRSARVPSSITPPPRPPAHRR